MFCSSTAVCQYCSIRVDRTHTKCLATSAHNPCAQIQERSTKVGKVIAVPHDRNRPVHQEGNDRAASHTGFSSGFPIQNGTLPQRLSLLQQRLAAVAHSPRRHLNYTCNSSAHTGTEPEATSYTSFHSIWLQVPIHLDDTSGLAATGTRYFPLHSRYNL